MPLRNLPGDVRRLDADRADGRGPRLSRAVCRLPATEGAHGISDWNANASIPGLAKLATDPYWKNFGKPAGPFVERFARLVADAALPNGVEPQLWVPSFGLAHEDIPELEAAGASARAAGVEDVWTWGYEA